MTVASLMDRPAHPQRTSPDRRAGRADRGVAVRWLDPLSYDAR
jgi:hypothetical protein